MAVYRFRILFEDYTEVYRDIDVCATQTFLDFHIAIHQSLGYDAQKSSSFYVSNDHWIKGTEIALLPTERKIERGVILMENAKLNQFVEDPHQKFYYIYNFDRPFDFQVELVKILDVNPSTIYPVVFKSEGIAPKIIEPTTVIPSDDMAFDDTNDEELEKSFFEAKEHEDVDALENDNLIIAEDDEENEFGEDYGEADEDFSSENNNEEDY